MEQKEEEISYTKKKELQEKKDEPSWYHYVIVLLVIFGVFLIIFFITKEDTICEEVKLKTSSRFKCPVTINERPGKVEFLAPIEEVRKYSYNFELNKYDLLNTKEFILSFDTYNDTDNGNVLLVSSRLSQIFRVYGFFFGNNSFVRTNTTTCTNSTTDRKVILFKPYENESEVEFNKENGCVTIKGENIEEFLQVGDSLILELIEG